MPIYELPVKNLTPPFASATPISCNRGITLLSEYIAASAHARWKYAQNSLTVLSNRHNFSPFIRNRGRPTRWWGLYLDRKQNWRYFCACALKKSPKHSENVFRNKSYSPVTGNMRRRMVRSDFWPEAQCLTETRPTAHTTKTVNIKKVLLCIEHVDIMATCCKSNSTFLIFAVLVVWFRPCRR